MFAIYMDTSNNNSEKPKLRDIEIGKYISNVSLALDDEIRAVESDKTKIFELKNGQWICETLGKHLYTFESDIGLPIPPDSGIRLYIGNKEVAIGELVAQEEFNTILVLDEEIGDFIPFAKISAYPVFIHKAVKQRLDDELEKEYDENRIKLIKYILNIEKQNVNRNDQGIEKAKLIFNSIKPRSLLPNNSQLTAIGYCSGSPMYFVWGPPGTGKTASVAQNVRVLVESGERLLVLSHTNAAVDVAMLRVADSFSNSDLVQKGKIIRYGTPCLPDMMGRKEILPEGILENLYPDLVNEKRTLEKRKSEFQKQIVKHQDKKTKNKLGYELDNVRNSLKSVNLKIDESIKKIISNSSVVGTTLSKMAVDGLIYGLGVNTVVIDESSIANFSAILAASFIARDRILFFGDFRQLPPIYLSNTQLAKRWLGRDVFEISKVKENIDNNTIDNRVTMLNVQYRMERSIADVVSRFAYNGKLKTSNEISEIVRLSKESQPYSNNSVVFIDTSELNPLCFKESKLGSYSRINIIHAVLANLISNRILKEKQFKTAIITPYRAQAKLISSIVKNYDSGNSIVASTVHRFQGSESDIVIFDFVDSFNEKSASKLTGTDLDTSLRLLNVAISRARGKLIVLCNSKFVYDKHPQLSPSRRVINLMSEFGNWHTLNFRSILNEVGTIPDISILNWENTVKKLTQEVKHIKNELFLNILPDFSFQDEFISNIKNSPVDDERKTIFSHISIAQLFEETKINLRLQFQYGGFFALLDNNIAYIGGDSRKGVFFKITNVEVVKILKEHLLGHTLRLPMLEADAEEMLQRIYGKCNECGEMRELQINNKSQLVLQCTNIQHKMELVNKELLEEIVDIMRVRCSECRSIARVIVKGDSNFLGCPNYKEGCRGNVPTIYELTRME